MFCLKNLHRRKICLDLEWKLTQSMLYFVLGLGHSHSIVFKSGLIFLTSISFSSLNLIRIDRISFDLMSRFNSLSFFNYIHLNEMRHSQIWVFFGNQTANILRNFPEKKYNKRPTNKKK